jgi:hypothetical protein
MKRTEQVFMNIAPSSDNGHFVKGKAQVIELDKVNETFVVVGESVLTTENHTTLKLDNNCLITCQQVFDPLKGIFEKSRD